MKSQANAERTAAPMRPSSARKVRAILEAAEALFLRTGYDGANLDDLSMLAGVSKQTIYTHFGDKERLFVSVVGHITADAASRVHYSVPDPADGDALLPYLQDYARRQLDVVLDERVLAIRRLVIAEAIRFPQLAETFWERGPLKAVEEMRDRFARFADAGLIVTPDPTASATAFNWLIMGQALNAAMLLGTRGIPDAPARARIAADATRIFLAAHTPPAG